jgi:hypothetical protein
MLWMGQNAHATHHAFGRPLRRGRQAIHDGAAPKASASNMRL